ncbi:MAG: polyprenol monophosphomannose synthase [Cyclobacteriaceae bacterium]
MDKRLVIIPTYNEQDNIREIIGAVMNLDMSFDVLIIDDGSPDGTANTVRELQAKWPEQLHMIEREGKLGLGTAYIRGFQYAMENDYDYVFEMDADFSHNPNDLIALYNACAGGAADMAIGSRYIKGVNVVNWPIGRVLMSYFASIYVRLVTGIPVMDTTAGFKCYHKNVLATIDPQKISFIGYAFQIEMKFTAWKHGFKIVEVPIIFTDRAKGTSKMSQGIFKEAVFGVLEMKIRSLFRKYAPFQEAS